MKLNKKILTLMLVFGVCATAAVAQITVVTGDNIKKSEPIDELVFRAQYELKMLEDTTRSEWERNHLFFTAIPPISATLSLWRT